MIDSIQAPMKLCKRLKSASGQKLLVLVLSFKGNKSMLTISVFYLVWENKDGKKEKEVKKEREPSQSTVKDEVEKPSSKKDNGTTKGKQGWT